MLVERSAWYRAEPATRLSYSQSGNSTCSRISHVFSPARSARESMAKVSHINSKEKGLSGLYTKNQSLTSVNSRVSTPDSDRVLLKRTIASPSTASISRLSGSSQCVVLWLAHGQLGTHSCARTVAAEAVADEHRRFPNKRVYPLGITITALVANCDTMAQNATFTRRGA